MKTNAKEIHEAFNRVVNGKSLPCEERAEFGLSESGFRHALIGLLKEGIITEAEDTEYKAVVRKTMGERRAKKLKKQTRNISEQKARIIAHFVADGTVYPPYMLKYYNKSSFLHEGLRKDIKLVYGISPSSFMKYSSKTFVSTWYSKRIIEDLLMYTPSYSTKQDSKVCIPEQVTNASKSIKREFLGAYMADDGCVRILVIKRKTGDGSERKVYKTTVFAWSENENFLKMLQKLFSHFGIKTRVRMKTIVLRDIVDVVRFYLSVGFQDGAICSKSKAYKGWSKNELLRFALRLDSRLNGKKRIWRKSCLAARASLSCANKKGILLSLGDIEKSTLSTKIQTLVESGFFDTPRDAREITSELMKRGLGTFEYQIVLGKLFANFVKSGILRCVGTHARQLFQGVRGDSDGEF